MRPPRGLQPGLAEVASLHAPAGGPFDLAARGLRWGICLSLARAGASTTGGPRGKLGRIRQTETAMPAPRLAFLATGRSGLGHLRRVASVARAVGRVRPGTQATLICNAAPDGLTGEDLAAFAEVRLARREDMARALEASGARLAVLDTMQLPGAERLAMPMIQILREMPDDRLGGFCRGGGRAWEAVLLPNPAGHWMPAVPAGFALRIEATGWIARRPGRRGAAEAGAGVVVATGGGGTAESRAALFPLLDAVIVQARAKAGRSFRVRQALGPRAAGATLGQADESFDPGPDLDIVFRAADLVVSTAGYNSVLELAATDTPAMLAAIPRSLDDQAARTRDWGPRLGHGLDPCRIEAAADWLAEQIANPRRRPPVDLGPDGAERAAGLILDYA